MILTHESGAQEDQFDGKKEGQKSRGTIPLTDKSSKIAFTKSPLTNGRRKGFNPMPSNPRFFCGILQNT
jgi:hypothetical protein